MTKGTSVRWFRRGYEGEYITEYLRYNVTERGRKSACENSEEGREVHNSMCMQQNLG